MATSGLAQFLHDAELDIASYERTIRDLESRLLQMKSRRDDLQQDVARVSSLLSPVRRIPTEILQEIFAFAGAERESNAFGVYATKESVALRVSAVCNRWRTVALDTPDLWTHFAAELQQRYRAPVDLFLVRSKQRPLALTITEPEKGGLRDDRLLGLLVAQASRWRSIDYDHVLDENYLRIIEEIPSLPSLSSLVCSVIGTSFAACLKECTSLNHLIVQYLYAHTLEVESLPLARVADLSIEYGKHGAFNNSLEILKACVDTVKTLTYESPSDHRKSNSVVPAQHAPLSAADLAREPIQCRILSSLEIYLSSHSGVYPHVSDILQSLTLPALRILAISGSCAYAEVHRGQWPGHALDGFFARSRCALTELFISGLPLSDTEILAALRYTSPALERLTIAEVCTADHFPDAVQQPLVQTITKSLVAELTVDTAKHVEGTLTPESSPFLPKLCFLELQVHRHFDADTEFVEMIKSRWYSSVAVSRPRHSSLRTANLYIRGRQIDESVYVPLKALDKEGMKIVVKGLNQGYIV
ncbi:hypothetical protein V5O48_005296 [Marasmius crinis-equi]|uniref:F-box domain-containing protein n=1 Tax=Marasmius crinis-equi TaxID=585013 RepID=A0ABR3FMU6_9AGAR